VEYLELLVMREEEMFLYRVLTVVVAHFFQTKAFGSTLKRLSGAHYGFEIAVPADVACYRVFFGTLYATYHVLVVL
jgi:hypothetical protein